MSPGGGLASWIPPPISTRPEAGWLHGFRSSFPEVLAEIHKVRLFGVWEPRPTIARFISARHADGTKSRLTSFPHILLRYTVGARRPCSRWGEQGCRQPAFFWRLLEISHKAGFKFVAPGCGADDIVWQRKSESGPGSASSNQRMSKSTGRDFGNFGRDFGQVEGEFDHCRTQLVLFRPKSGWVRPIRARYSKTWPKDRTNSGCSRSNMGHQLPQAWGRFGSALRDSDEFGDRSNVGRLLTLCGSCPRRAWRSLRKPGVAETHTAVSKVLDFQKRGLVHVLHVLGMPWDSCGL